MTARAVRLTLLTQANCAYCDHAKDVLARVAADYPRSVTEVDLDTPQGRELATRHGVLFAPEVLLDDQPRGYGHLSEKRLRKALQNRDKARQV